MDLDYIYLYIYNELLKGEMDINRAIYQAIDIHTLDTQPWIADTSFSSNP